MFRTKNDLNRLIYSIVLWLFLCFATKAQEGQRYQGPLTIGNYSGDADYYFDIIDSDTVLNGSFLLKKANLDALLQKQDYSFQFSGNFTNNFPQGSWRFQFGEFQSNNESQVVDYQYRVAISGVQEEASGLMSNGRPDGLWTYEVSQIEDSKVSHTLFKSTITFDKGIPQQNFRIENDSITLAGRFLRNGLAHDEWSLFELSGFGASESWFFTDGLLDKIQIELDGSTNTTSIYDGYKGETKTISLDSKYINAIALYQTSDILVGGKMQRLLSQNASYYKKIDGILSELGESAFLPEFKVKVPYYPFSDKEKQYMDIIVSNYQLSREISSSFIEDTQLNILKLSDGDAAFQYEVIKKITEEFLLPIGQLVEFNEKEIIEYVSRNKLIQNLWPSGKPESELNVSITIDSITANRQFKIQGVKNYVATANNLQTVKQLSEQALESLNRIQNELQQRLTNEKRQQEIIAVEEQLISQRNTMHLLIDSLIIDIPSANQNALNSIKEYADNALSAYSTLDSNNRKLSSGRDLSICYDKLQLLASNVADLPQQEVLINEKYQDRVWNPFMATLMDEEVKKRITSAYRKILIPYFLEQVQSDLECQKIEGLNLLMKDTYQRMLELRVENTSKLERKLRKVTNPQIVFELIGLQPISKQQ